MSLRSRIIKIGNSRGVRIPASVLEQLKLDGEVELVVEGDHLILRPLAKHCRDGWDDAFRRMREQGDDRPLDGVAPHSKFDLEEWEWS